MVTVRLKSTHGYRHVNDTFIVWSHGKETVTGILNNLKSCHQNIGFRMKEEIKVKLVFFDILINRNQDRVAHSVYRTPNHTDTYKQILTTT